MDGKNYRACVRLSTPEDETLADVGETCDRVQASSLGWLADQHLIEPVSTITETTWHDLGRPNEPVVPSVSPISGKGTEGA